MRIIKEGKIPNIEYIFVCNYCGCEFAVTETELINGNPFSDKNSYSCPTCHKNIYSPEKHIIEEETPELPVEDETVEL